MLFCCAVIGASAGAASQPLSVTELLATVSGMRHLIDPRTGTALSLPAVFAGARDRAADAVDRLIHGARQLATVLRHRLEDASGELPKRSRPACESGRLETLVGVMEHEPPPEELPE